MFRRLSCFALSLSAPVCILLPAAGVTNILLILSDDQSYPHVGCYGNPDIKTPNLDRFAAQGIRMDRAYVCSPQCVPSRASIFTGRGPVDIDMSRFSAPLPRSIVTYPELLKQAGWFTGVAGRTYHMDGSQMPETRELFEKERLATFPDRLDFVKTAGENSVSLPQFREFLDARPKDRPFMLQLCSNDPHRPLNTRGPAKHDPATLKLPAHYPDTKLVREDFARYFDEIAHFDQFFGEVMAELDRRGLADSTLVAYMADNGAAQFRGKGTLFELGIHVPLILRWPGRIKPGSTSDALISGEDLAPTFLEACGRPVPREMTGRSFLKVLLGQPFEGREFVFAERGAHGSSLPGNSASFDLGRVIVGKRYKLIYNAMPDIPYWPVDFAGDAMWQELVASNKAGTLSPELSARYFSAKRPMFELYDLQSDPAELTNLAEKPELKDTLHGLKSELARWMILQRDYVPLPIQKIRGQAGGGKGKGKQGGKKS